MRERNISETVTVHEISLITTFDIVPDKYDHNVSCTLLLFAFMPVLYCNIINYLYVFDIIAKNKRCQYFRYSNHNLTSKFDSLLILKNRFYKRLIFD